ncbi:MAG: plasmid pRiA4b ORF-3 family protein [Chloroflexota bacterium]
MRLSNEYDFGDSWEVRLVLEDVLRSVEIADPRCLDGARAGPLDDCGGVPGYENLLEALANAQHPDHGDLVEWSGGNYDPEVLDREAINRALAFLRRLR